MKPGARSMVVNRRRLAQTTAAGAASAALLGVPLASLAQGATPGASPVAGGTLVVYCGRNEELVGALVPEIETATGLTLDVRYGNTAELAAQILEEGDNSPAGLYFGQDAGALGALASEGRLTELPASILDLVEGRFRSPEGYWVGVSGRARVLAYNTETVDVTTLPASILGLPTTEVGGDIGWAPTNASFQSFVTALRVTEGEDGARSWLEAMVEAGVVAFDGNDAILEAVGSGELAVGLVNHYYLYQARKETPDIAAENYFFPDGDLGSMINVAGVGVLAGSGQEDAALAITEFLLGEAAQTYFAQETSEYPLAAGVPAIEGLTPLAEIETPDLDLSDLEDLEGTVALLTEVGLI
jgi:iron(III) transport system substrate-binding protein